MVVDYDEVNYNYKLIEACKVMQDIQMLLCYVVIRNNNVIHMAVH